MTPLRQHLYLTMSYFPLLQAMKHTRAPLGGGQPPAAPASTGGKPRGAGPGAAGTHQPLRDAGGPHFVPPRLHPLRSAPPGGHVPSPSAGTGFRSSGSGPASSLPAPPGRGRHGQAADTPSRKRPCRPSPGPAAARRSPRLRSPSGDGPLRSQPPGSSLSLHHPHLSAATGLKVEPGHPPLTLRGLSGKLR